MKTKPFDIEKAKAGHPVCTRDFRPVRIVCYDMTDGSEAAYVYKHDGTFLGCYNSHAADLQLAATRHTAWINIYKYPDTPFVETGRCIYESKEEAKSHAMTDEEHAYIDTVQITWEA